MLRACGMSPPMTDHDPPTDPQAASVPPLPYPGTVDEALAARADLRRPPHSDPALADELIARLNRLLNNGDDIRRDISTLALLRIIVFPETANHDTLQVGQESESMPAQMSFIGLLNGLCGTIAPLLEGEAEDVRDSSGGVVRSDRLVRYGFITHVWEEGQLVRFCRTGSIGSRPVDASADIVQSLGDAMAPVPLEPTGHSNA